MFGILTCGATPEPAARAMATVSDPGRTGRPAGRAARISTSRWSPFAENFLTHDEARYARNNAHVRRPSGLALGPPTFGWLTFAFRAMDELQKAASITRVEIPVTVVAAGDDRIADNVALKKVTARFPNGRYVEVPGAFHEILQETDAHRAVFWREFDDLADKVAPRAHENPPPQWGREQGEGYRTLDGEALSAQMPY